MGRVAIGEYPFFPLSSFRANARNLFRSRSGKMGGQRKTGSTVFLKTCNHDVSRKLIHTGHRTRQTKKIPRLRSGRRYESALSSRFFSSHCESQPPPLRTASFQRKEGTMRESPFPQRGYKKTQPLRAALSDFKNYTLKRK